MTTIKIKSYSEYEAALNRIDVLYGSEQGSEYYSEREFLKTAIEDYEEEMFKDGWDGKPKCNLSNVARISKFGERFSNGDEVYIVEPGSNYISSVLVCGYDADTEYYMLSDGHKIFKMYTGFIYSTYDAAKNSTIEHPGYGFSFGDL